VGAVHRHPGTWIGSSVLMMVIVLGVQIVPVFGQIAVSVLLPCSPAVGCR
jgi:hypothetical protein